MLRSYRNIVFALVGWLTLSAANQPTKHAEGDKSAPKAEAARPSFAAYPQLNSDACYRAKDHEAADLCAQWRAAIAAEKTARESRRATTWSIIATFLGFATVAGLIITIWQTFGALGEARRGNLIAQRANARATRQSIAAAADTKAAIAVAERQADIAADIAQRQLRAYLDFDGIKWLRDESRDEEDRMMTGISYGVKNFGHTPATNVSILHSYFVRLGGDDTPRHLADSDEAVGVIAPTDHVTKNGYFHLPPNVWASIGKREVTFIAKILVSYSDDFGTERTLGSSFESNGHVDLGFIAGTRFAT